MAANMRLDQGRYLPLPAPTTEIAIEEMAPRHLGDYLAVLRRHQRLAVLAFGATVLLAMLVTILTPRRYTAWTRLQVGRQSSIQLHLQNNVISLDDGEHGDRAAIAFVGTQATALHSRDLAERVMRRYGLAESPAFLEPAKHRTGPLSLPAGVQEPFSPRGLVTETDPALDGHGDHAPVAPKLLDRYMRYLSVKQVAGTDLIDVSFVTPSPTLSAFLAGAHAQAYLEANDDLRHATDVVARRFLGQKIVEASKRVKRADAALDRFATRHPDVAVDEEHKVGGQRILELSTLLTRAETDRVALEGRYQFLTNPRSDPLAYFLDRPGVEKLRLALLDVQAQRAGFDERLGENHPRMVELGRLQSEIGDQLKGEVARDVASVRAHYDAAREREEGLRRKLEQQQTVGTEMNRLGARYELLRNDVQTARNLHTSLREQQLATAAHSDLGASNVAVIERPEVPERPSRPKLPLNLALGVAAGLVVALGAAFGRDYFDHSVRTSEEAERFLQAPALATIPRFGTNGHIAGAPPRHELVLLREPASAVAEAFRAMRTALLFSNATAPRVIVITSARAGEGKTVASLNLATALAQSGSRVLLVEADLRHPRCHDLFGLYDVGGLSSFLSGETDDLDELILRLDAPGLFFLPCGPLPENPADLVGSQRMHEALGVLRMRYDFVVIDTPPVLPVTDAVVLGREADGVVLVVKGNETPRELVRRAHDRLVQMGGHLVGVIVNDVEPTRGDPYFYDPYYVYGKRPSAGSDDGHGGPFLRRAWDSNVIPAATRAADWVKGVAQMARGGRGV
jgi:succinoglycan biosynthesis transport protein ExoP